MLQHFGLVVLGAHSGVHLRELISRNFDKNILLVEPVPYNYLELEKVYKDSKNIIISKKSFGRPLRTISFYNPFLKF